MATHDSQDPQRIEQFIDEAAAENQVLLLSEGPHRLHWKNELTQQRSALGVWSGEKRTEQLCKTDFEGNTLRTVDLCAFLHVWLPAVSANQHLIALNGSRSQNIVCVEPHELRGQLLEKLPQAVIAQIDLHRKNDLNYHYITLGEFPIQAAQKLIEAYEAKSIRFDSSTEPTQLKGEHAILAGEDAQPERPGAQTLHLSVYNKDIEQAETIMEELFGLIEASEGDEISFIEDELDRLKHYSENEPHLHFYLKHNARTTDWIKVAADDVDITQVEAFVVTYPSGTLLDSANAVAPHPEGMKVLKASHAENHPAFDYKLVKGSIKIKHRPCAIRPTDQKYYATTLTNRSKEPVRVQHMAFSSTNLKGLFKRLPTDLTYLDAEHFNEAFRVADDAGWIQPGETVTNAYNMSPNRGHWIYFMETQSNQPFITVSPVVGKKVEE